MRLKIKDKKLLINNNLPCEFRNPSLKSGQIIIQDCVMAPLKGLDILYLQKKKNILL